MAGLVIQFSSFLFFIFWLITTYIEKEENDHNKGTQP